MKNVLITLIMGLMFIGVVAATPGSGSIWTTNNDCGNETQNQNHYAMGETIYINGANFDAATYDWDITGLNGQASCDPGLAVAFGNETVDGEFCFAAYTVMNDDCGEYKVSFGKKNDNYRVDREIHSENEVPEFGVLAAFGVLALAGLFIYKRRN